MTSVLNFMKTQAPDDTSNRKRLVRDSLVELLATTVFVYAGTLSAVSTGAKLTAQGNTSEDVARILPIAMAFGVSILALASSIGHLTGGHMNPGVTLLMFFKRKISAQKMLCYWFCQFLGSIIASSLVWGSSSELDGTLATGTDEVVIFRPPFNLGATTLSDNISVGNGFLLELMGSFLFYFVIAQTALDKRGMADTALAPIPIGLILVVVHICLVRYKLLFYQLFLAV